jgi:hypothetical protein
MTTRDPDLFEPEPEPAGERYLAIAVPWPVGSYPRSVCEHCGEINFDGPEHECDPIALGMAEAEDQAREEALERIHERWINDPDGLPRPVAKLLFGWPDEMEKAIDELWIPKPICPKCGVADRLQWHECDPDCAQSKPCECCGKAFVPNKAGSRFCSPSCKQRAYRRRVTDRHRRAAVTTHPRYGSAVENIRNAALSVTASKSEVDA